MHRAGVRYFRAGESALTSAAGPGVPAHNEDGVIGWGTSWRMQGHLLMAERTGDPRHAERLADLADRVLAVRDDERGVSDHRGRSRPVWSSAGKFTAASAVVPDTDGHPALEVTVCPPHSRDVQLTVEPEEGGRFRLTAKGPRRQTFTVPQLCLDPADARRADHVLYQAYAQRSAVTARLLPPPDEAGGGSGAGAGGREAARGPVRSVRAGVYRVQPARVALAAQTGMITYPIAGLLRLSRERPDAVPRTVRARLDGYLDAIVRALAAHDEQWQETEDGRGCYRWLPDEPVSFAGAELPTNEFLAVGRTLVQLAVVTGEEAHIERAAAMARALHGDLTVTDGAAAWPYWPSFGRVYQGWEPTGTPATDGSLLRPSYAPVAVPEDVTHALIDVDFLRLYHETPGLPPVFGRAELRSVAAAFLRHATHRENGAWRLRHDVGGAGRTGTAREQAHVAGWLPLRRWLPGLARRVRAIQPVSPPPPMMGVDTYCGALLARWG